MKKAQTKAKIKELKRLQELEMDAFAHLSKQHEIDKLEY